jgi:hypothetical protein
VRVEQDDVGRARGEQRGVVRARRACGDVEMAEVEQHPRRGRVQAAHEIADGERVVAAPSPPARMNRREVLDRNGDGKGMRPLEERDEGPLLELGALAEARGRGAVGFREVEAVVGDELGAGGRRVVEQAVERAVVLDRPGAQVVGRVEQQPQRGAVERRAQRAGMAQPVAALAEHRPRRSVDLDPGEAGRLVGGEHGRGGPGVAVDVEAESSVHEHRFDRGRPRSVARA